MVDKNLFIETLHEVAEIARTSQTPLTAEDVDKYFGNMDLSQEQQQMVVDYLQLPQEVRDYVPQAADDPETEQEAEKISDYDTENTASAKERSDAEEAGDAEDAGETEVAVDQLSDSAYYKVYLNEVRALSVGNEEDQLALYQKLLDGDQSAVEQIVDNWLMRVIEMAGFYKDTEVNMEDLIQEGNMGLFLALNQIPADKEAADVELYLIEQVKDAMENYIREITGNEEQIQAMLGKYGLLRQAQEMLAKENAEEPSLRQLSEYTRIPAEEIQNILALFKDIPDSAI